MNNITANIDKENKTFNSLQNQLNESVGITNDAIVKVCIGIWPIMQH